MRFFFHFQRIFECAFFHGLDLCPPPRRRSITGEDSSVKGGHGEAGEKSQRAGRNIIGGGESAQATRMREEKRLQRPGPGAAELY